MKHIIFKENEYEFKRVTNQDINKAYLVGYLNNDGTVTHIKNRWDAKLSGECVISFEKFIELLNDCVKCEM